MPIYCPQDFSRCDNICRYRYQKQCYWFQPPQPLSEIFTLSERIEELEKNQAPVPEAEWTHKQYDEVQQLKGRLLFLENKVMEMRATKRKKGRYLD